MAGRDKITWPENLFDWSTNFWGSWEGGFRREARGERRGGAGQGRAGQGSTGSTGRAAREEQGGEVGFEKCRKLRANGS